MKYKHVRLIKLVVVAVFIYATIKVMVIPQYAVSSDKYIGGIALTLGWIITVIEQRLNKGNKTV